MPEKQTTQASTAQLANAALYEQVRRWYLARLRKSAVLSTSTTDNTTLTPARLIAVDRDYVEKMILEHPSAVRKAKVRAKAFEAARSKIQTEPLQQSWEQKSKQIVILSGAIQFLSLLVVAIGADFAGLPTSIAIAAIVAVASLLFLAKKAKSFVGASTGKVDEALQSVSNQQVEQIQLSGVREIDLLTTVVHDLSHQLTESQTREEVIADHALDLIFAIDRDGKFRSISQSSNRILGYIPKKLEGKSISTVVAESDVQKILGYLNAPERGGEIALEISATNRNGGRLDLSWLMEWSNTEDVMFCTARDITLEKESERILRESEATMRALIDNMPIGLVTLATDGRIDSTNPRVREIFGYSAGELERAHPEVLFGEKSVSREQYVDELARETFGKIFELKTKKKDGSRLNIETSCSTIHTTAGEKLLVTIVDVSDRHELEKLKRRFVALVSHELRTPLTSIQLFLELLTAGSLGEISEQAKKRARGVIDHLRRLLNLVEDLLSVEKMASGQFSMKFSELNLQEVIGKATDAVEEVAQKAGVAIAIECAPISIVADEERLMQALINLISNAIKFSDRGSTVTVVAELLNSTVNIKVIDRGPGIAPGVAAGLFQPFRQSPDEQSRVSRRGTGLGLYICKVIIEQHGGTVSLDSEEGKGSTFILQLPISPTNTTN